jgi:histidinol phosphatase-like enzyme (inositol monophosphatase family)
MPVSKDFLFSLAEAAALETLPRFRQSGAIENKLDAGFDPVTEADKAAESAIRALIGTEFPSHGILGEEHGAMGLDRDHVWVIDPIDGTRAFISGLPVWGTLIGLTLKGKAMTGVMSQPFTGEIFYALDGASHLARNANTQTLKTRRTMHLRDATMFTTTPHLFKGEDRTRFETLESKVRLSRYGCDCYAYCMVAAGHADLVVEPGLKPYDIVALIPIIENAGGVVTCWDGSPAEKGGDIIAAATPELHKAALEIMRPLSDG